MIETRRVAPWGDPAERQRRGVSFAAAMALALVAAAPTPGTSAAATRVETWVSDVVVHDPGAEDTCNTQTGVTLARAGSTVVAGWADGGDCRFLTEESGTSISGVSASSDGGRTWGPASVLPPPPGGSVWGDSVVAADASGTFFHAALVDEPVGEGDAFRFRRFIGVYRWTGGSASWSGPVDASAGRDVGVQDKPWIAVDTTRSKYRGSVYAAWTEFLPEGGRVMVLSRSVNGGTSFEAPLVLPAPLTGSCEPRIGIQVAVGPRGEVYVVWIGEAFRICFQGSVDGGRSFTDPVEIVHPDPIGHGEPNCQPKNVRLDDPVSAVEHQQVLNGDIRVEEWPSLAVDTSSRGKYRGRIYVAFPSRGAQATADEADVFLATSSDGGRSWAGVARDEHGFAKPSFRVSDQARNDQFHPQVAVSPSGIVMVTWYDRRLSVDPVQPNWEIDLFGSVSTDGGNSFGDDIRITDVSFPPSQTNPNTNGMAGCFMGDYNGLVAVAPNTFLAGWGDNRTVTGGVPDPDVYVDGLSIIQ